MKSSLISGYISIACLALFFFAAEALSRPMAKEPRFDGPALDEAIVRAAYANLEQFVSSAGPDFSLEVGEIQHIEAQDFDAHLWLDAVSRPEGLLVDMQRRVERLRGRAAPTVVYEPGLRFVEGPLSADLESLPGMSIAQVIERISEQDPENLLSRASGLTTFTVQVRLGASSRDYRASFMWVPTMAKAGEQTAVVIFDHVTQGVEEAARESLEPFSPGSVSPGSLAPGSISPGSLAPGPYLPALSAVGSAGTESGRSAIEKEDEIPELKNCTPSSETEIMSFADQNFALHHFGGHWASVDFAVTCDCNRACESTCTAEVADSECYENGIALDFSCHRMEQASAGSSETHDWTAQCGAGFICAAKSCLYCSCGLAVGVTVDYGPSGIEISFSAEPDLLWIFERQVQRTCHCEEDWGTGDSEDEPEEFSGPPSFPSPPYSGDPAEPGGGIEMDVYCGGVYSGKATSISKAVEICRNKAPF